MIWKPTNPDLWYPHMQDVGVWIYDISRAGAGQTLLIEGADMYHAPDVCVYTYS